LAEPIASPPPSASEIEVSELAQQSPLSMEERKRVLSTGRLKLTLTAFVVTVLLALSGMIFSGVTRIFDWLTPSIQQDLVRKTRRGAVELAQTAQLGMVVGDAQMIAGALSDYTQDHDVVGLKVLDTDGKTLFEHGRYETQIAQLLASPPGATHELGSHYGSWMPSEIEGALVGRVAVLVSKARLEAGLELRREILFVAAGGCLVALLACLAFVSMYIGPILRLTADAFVRLERTTESALAAARMKSQFLANMSHEIRTPMNGIIGVLDLLNRTTLNPKQQRYAQTIESSARGLLTIINDVLDFSKLEAGKYEVRVDDFEVSQLVQEVAELLSPKAHAKHLELVVRIDRDVPEMLRADSDRVKQVLMNLVGNAVKFTDHGYVELHVSLDPPGANGAQLRFSVKDSGQGIRPEDQVQLFGVFSQVDGSLTRKHGGTGLGLAISKRLAEAMGGAIGVESTYGQGSTFWFTVRVTPSQTLTHPALPRPEAAILLVTRLPVQREALRELIERWGMACTAVERAEDASEQVVTQAGGFTAAVIDGGFEGSDPASSTLFDLCAAEGLPVIRLLSTTQIADERTGESLQSVLCKPVRASELYNGLVALLDGGVISTRKNVQEVNAQASWRPGRGRVLVVDDNEINRLVAVELLSELGYDTDTASNGLEAVARVKAETYGVILMDCQMPELDGFGATAQIRQLPGPMAKVPIIALTAHAMADDRDRVLRGGMDDYATKPIRARVLERLLRRWITSTSEPIPTTSQVPRENSPAADKVPNGAAAPNLRLVRVAPGAEGGEGPELDPSLPRSARAIELFLKTVPELIEALTSAVNVGDAPQVKQLAHKLKGNCLSLGATRMAASCHAVELAALDGRIDVEANARIPAQLAVVAPLLSQLQQRRPSNDA
jgi:signal transduction histidine kinase/DNA-binding response OmpR family regulator/HPt (histidine-containing phosphotransfer) domain-containing protein